MLPTYKPSPHKAEKGSFQVKFEHLTAETPKQGIELFPAPPDFLKHP